MAEARRRRRAAAGARGRPPAGLEAARPLRLRLTCPRLPFVAQLPQLQHAVQVREAPRPAITQDLCTANEQTRRGGKGLLPLHHAPSLALPSLHSQRSRERQLRGLHSRAGAARQLGGCAAPLVAFSLQPPARRGHALAPLTLTERSALLPPSTGAPCRSQTSMGGATRPSWQAGPLLLSTALAAACG